MTAAIYSPVILSRVDGEGSRNVVGLPLLIPASHLILQNPANPVFK